jgi:prephenate dehydrogenase
VIVGTGLMGASFGLALRRRGLAERVIGLARRPETLRSALEIGAVDETAADIRSALPGADLVVVATPVSAIVPILREVANFAEPNCLISDMGSVKAPVVRSAEQFLPPHLHFVGGHPMCGSEESGPLAAKADLYENAVWVITPTERTHPDALNRMIDLVRAVGAKPLQLSPEEHDEAVAAASHLPHVVACALALAVGKAAAENSTVADLCAGGYRDTTRIAAGNSEMWRDILIANAPNILKQIETASEFLGRFRDAVSSNDAEAVSRLLKEAAEARRACFSE